MDIIMFSLARWDGPYSSTAFSLAKEFSIKHRVFYIDNPFTLKYFLKNLGSLQVKKRIPALLLGKEISKEVGPERAGLITVTPRLTIPINFLPKGNLYEQLSKVNDRIIFKALKEIIREYTIENFIFINCFNPFYLRNFPKFFSPRLFVYITVDDIQHSRHIKKHGYWLEDEMIKRADIVFATSYELRKLKESISPNVFPLPNAADVSLFKTSMDDLPKPEEFKAIELPIVLYTGNIDKRIDYVLLASVIDQLTNMMFVFVGPIAVEPEAIEQLQKRRNVLFIGRKDIAELPAYLKYASCTIIPFVCNTLTKSIYPLKINEYLAAGRPVVSTPFSKDIQDFEKVATIKKGASNFADGIIEVIESDSKEKELIRLDFVESNTWESRVKLFWETIRSNGLL